MEGRTEEQKNSQDFRIKLELIDNWGWEADQPEMSEELSTCQPMAAASSSTRLVKFFSSLKSAWTFSRRKPGTWQSSNSAGRTLMGSPPICIASAMRSSSLHHRDSTDLGVITTIKLRDMRMPFSIFSIREAPICISASSIHTRIPRPASACAIRRANDLSPLEWHTNTCRAFVERLRLISLIRPAIDESRRPSM